jgi:2-polyprenyl-3-methyl-5-hydroxy-6-metoxy-1,4-benzoquinol methylase
MEEKLIAKQNEWGKVAEELAAEDLKLAFYDGTLLSILGNIEGKTSLDYGCGPGVLATALTRGGSKVFAYDISKDMRDLVGQKIGHSNVYSSVDEIPSNQFDNIICNLVMCIVDETEVERITKKIAKSLNSNGRAYIGFCNPKLLSIPETNLDLRPKPKCDYDVNHSYMKTKKEGDYEIIENHRPIEWYESVFKNAGLNVVKKHFTPEYKLNDKTIEDFIIFELEVKKK